MGENRKKLDALVIEMNNEKHRPICDDRAMFCILNQARGSEQLRVDFADPLAIKEDVDRINTLDGA